MDYWYIFKMVIKWINIIWLNLFNIFIGKLLNNQNRNIEFEIIIELV